MALFLLQVTFPSVSTVHCPCPVPQQTGHGEQDTCSARPPAFLSPAQASADLNQRMDLAQNQPTPLLQNCSAPQSSQPGQKWPRARPAQGKPKSILFRQIYPQLWNRLSPIPATASSVGIARRNSHRGGSLLGAGGVHSPQSHAGLTQFLPEDHKCIDFPKDSTRQTESAAALIPSTLSSAKLEVALAKQH